MNLRLRIAIFLAIMVSLNPALLFPSGPTSQADNNSDSHPLITQALSSPSVGAQFPQVFLSPQVRIFLIGLLTMSLSPARPAWAQQNSYTVGLYGYSYATPNAFSSRRGYLDSAINPSLDVTLGEKWRFGGELIAEATKENGSHDHEVLPRIYGIWQTADARDQWGLYQTFGRGSAPTSVSFGTKLGLFQPTFSWSLSHRAPDGQRRLYNAFVFQAPIEWTKRQLTVTPIFFAGQDGKVDYELEIDKTFRRLRIVVGKYITAVDPIERYTQLPSVFGPEAATVSHVTSSGFEYGGVVARIPSQSEPAVGFFFNWTVKKVQPRQKKSKKLLSGQA